MKVLIVGGVAGGASAAARIRRLDENAQVIMFERSGYISSANCGLPDYVGGAIKDAAALTVQSPEGFAVRFRVDVRVRSEVTSIDVQNKKVTVRELDGGRVYEESYDKLLLSPGARPTRPNMQGVEDDRVFTLRTVEDTFHIREFVERRAPKSAVVVGGGYIGLEMAENLIRLGVQVTILEMAEHVLAPLDYDMACEVHAYLRSKGVELMRRTTVTGFSRQGDRLFVSLQDAQPLPADLVILATGVTPETTLAKEAGLELGLRGAIVVDEHMRTSIEDIYAVGDAVQVRHFVSGAPVLLPLAGPANKQGRIAADNICGKDSRFEGKRLLLKREIHCDGLAERSIYPLVLHSAITEHFHDDRVRSAWSYTVDTVRAVLIRNRIVLGACSIMDGHDRSPNYRPFLVSYRSADGRGRNLRECAGHSKNHCPQKDNKTFK